MERLFPIFLIISFFFTLAISLVSSNPTAIEVPAAVYLPKHYIPTANVYAPTLSFHTKPNFIGQELFFDGSWLSLQGPIKFRSHRFTGGINWTVYPNSNYTGQPTCLISDPEERMTYNYELPITVGSIRRGCWCNYSIKVTPRPNPKYEKHENEENKVLGVQLWTAHNAGGRSVFTDALETRLPSPLSMKSFGLTGKWKNWTVFSNEDLSGDSYCLDVKNTKEDEYTNIRETFKVRSIREGCVSERSFEPLETSHFWSDDQSGGSAKMSLEIGILVVIAFSKYFWNG